MPLGSSTMHCSGASSRAASSSMREITTTTSGQFSALRRMNFIKKLEAQNTLSAAPWIW